MAMTPEELEALTFQHLPETYLRRALKAIFSAHRIARDEARQSFAATEAENVLPFMRRGKLEGFLREAADLTPGVEATVVRAAKNFWNHTEIRSGIVVLTESAVQTPCALVEKSEARVTLARSGQMRLQLFDEPIETDAPLYLLLLHSRYHPRDADDLAANGHLPGSAYIAIPSPDLDAYVHEIDLFARFADVVAAELPQEWDGDAYISYLNRARKAASA